MSNENSPQPVNRIFGHSEPTPQEIAERCDRIRHRRRDNAHEQDVAARKFRAHLRFIQFLSETSPS